MVIGPSSTCIKNCKEIGKFRYNNECVNSCKYNYKYYHYEIDNEEYCINEEECYSIGKYPIRKNNNYICSDECDNSNCITTCGNDQYYSIPNKECVNSCKSLGFVLYNKYCLKDCPIFAKYIFKGTNEDICVKDCPENSPYLDYESGICIMSCNELYIFEGNKCIKSCPNTALYVNKIENNKYCVKDCHELGLYNVINDKICTDNCKKKTQYLAFNNCFQTCGNIVPYKYEDENEYSCHKNCSEIGLLTDLTLELCTTNCKKTGKKLFGNICVTECPLNSKYIYTTNDEDYCVKSCSLYNQKSVYSTKSEISCIGLSCKENNLFLFNDMCMNCPSITFKVYGANENFCTTNCAEFGLIEDYTTSTCIIDNSLTCTDSQFKNYMAHNCVNKCPNNIPFVQDSICVKKCEKYFYEDANGNKICTNDCSDKFILVNEGKCISSCDSINNYQLNGYNLCFSKCNEHSFIPRYDTLTQNIFSKCVVNCENNDNTKQEDDCIKECLIPFKFKLKDNSNKLCYQTCKEMNKYEYIDDEGNYLCVDNCKDLDKILYKNKCVNKCPKESPIKFVDNEEYKCIENCGANQFIKIDDITNEYSCINNCKNMNLILYSNHCIKECPKERPFIIDENNEKKCSDKCGEDKFINIIKNLNSEKYECVDSCNSLNKFVDGKTCVDSCPSLKQYKILKNNELFCSLSCDNEYKYINYENNGISCIKSCKSVGKLIYNGNCVKDCPDNKKIEIQINNEIECSSQCEDNKYILEQENKNICVSDCSLYNKFLFEGSCISECPEGKYLYENLSQNSKQCVEDCNIHNLYINDNKCVADCKIFNKFIFEGKCLKECPNDFPYSSNGICKSDSCEDGKFYDIFNKKCFDKCESNLNYRDYDTNLCINSCKNLISDNSNKIYSIQENKCISNCNEENKYLYLYNNDYYCIDNCIDNGLMISEDGKYCIKNCDEDTPYIKNNQCVKTCGDSYIKNNKECVENCPNDLPYIYKNECVSSCYDEFLYKIYDTNICIDACSNSLILNTDNKPKYYLDNYH